MRGEQRASPASTAARTGCCGRDRPRPATGRGRPRRRSRLVRTAPPRCRRRPRRGAVDVAHQVLDVDACRPGRRASRDRPACANGRTSRKPPAASASVHADLDGLDVGARHHDVVDAHVAEPQDVGEHRPLFGREAAVRRSSARARRRYPRGSSRSAQAHGRLQSVEPAPRARAHCSGRYCPAPAAVHWSAVASGLFIVSSAAARAA